MNELKKKMVQNAEAKFNEISPCFPLTELNDCFFVEGNTIYFWFNTQDNSTHLECMDIY